MGLGNEGLSPIRKGSGKERAGSKRYRVAGGRGGRGVRVRRGSGIGGLLRGAGGKVDAD